MAKCKHTWLLADIKYAGKNCDLHPILEDGYCIWHSPKPQKNFPHNAREFIENRIREKAPMAGFKLAGLDLSGADLQGAQFVEADLRNVNLQSANLENVYLPGANLQGANLKGAYLQNTQFLSANFEGMDLTGFDFRGAELDGAIFRNANLKGANLEGINMREALLEGTILDQANMRGAVLHKIKQETIMVGCSLVETDLEGANMDGANLQNANLTRTNLKNTILTSAIFCGATLYHTDFRGADVRSSVFDGAFLREVKFQGANLSNSTFKNIQFHLGHFNDNQEFIYECLYGANFSKAILDNTELQGVEMDPFSQFSLVGAQHQNALLDEELRKKIQHQTFCSRCNAPRLKWEKTENLCECTGSYTYAICHQCGYYYIFDLANFQNRCYHSHCEANQSPPS
ncbi:MAG: pentapeptide repeat-containing protein [Planctomycetota bacterium]|nr:MAG: pentapeptide repeat-containing protein [Planctomycetota bacterium]